MAGSVPVLKLPDNNIFVFLSYLLWTLWSIFQFAYIATAKSRVSAKNIGKKVSALPHSSPLFTAVMLTFLWQIYQISSYSSQSLRGGTTP